MNMKRKLLTLTVGHTVITAMPVVIAVACAVTAAMVSLAASAQDATFREFRYEGNDARFQKQFDPKREYLNPILAGFYPDPSVCRKGDTYYLVNSSFSFFPGVPIFKSRDMVNWEQIGHVLDRPSQLPLAGQGVSGGIFAPAISYNEKNKTFYMITTNVGRGNFFVKTKDPENGWSEPIYLPQVDGIDPSFFFDRDGRGYIVHNAPVDGGADYEGQRAIRLLEFDVKGDSVKGDYRQIVRGGTHVSERPIWIEGPHLLRVGKFYYLICAEGGTGEAHSEVVFRAKSPFGPYEECPDNPILTQREGLDELRQDYVSSAGHADFVQTPGGDWWAVFLGCRPYDLPLNAQEAAGPSHRPVLYNTGRDTYLLPVTWKDGWPSILKAGKAVPTVGKYDAAPQQTASLLTGNFAYTDRFDGDRLHYRWLQLRDPQPSAYTLDGNGLTIHPAPTNIYERKNLTALFTRQQHECFTAETSVSFTPASENQLAGLALLQNEDHNFTFGKTMQNGHEAVVLTRAGGKVVRPDGNIVTAVTVIASAPVASTSLRLKVEGRGRYYDFLYADGTAGQWKVLARGVDAANLSTNRSGGFIGACIGLYATSHNQ